MSEQIKLGLYVCSGCEIGNCVDCQNIAETVGSEYKAVTAKVKPMLCADEAIAEINADISAEGLNRVIIAACSPRYLTDIFRFGDNVLTERVNLREHVAWIQVPKEDETQLLAVDYCRMGAAKTTNSQIPEPIQLDINDTLLVIGGGVSGLNSALAAARDGYNVVLAEKDERLGGFLTKVHRLTPQKAPYYDLQLNNIGDIVASVESHPKIKVLKSCTIHKISGQPGLFNVTAESYGESYEFQVGAIIQATGWRPYNPAKLDYLGYGKIDNVITNVEMEALAKEGNIRRKSNDKPINNVVFIQCAGSRDENHLPYCSSVCCMTSLKQALYVREQYPDSKIYIIYKDVRTPAQYERFYKRVQSEENIFLTKGEIADISENGNGTIYVDVDNTLVGENIRIEADMVVLAAGLVPTTLVEEDTSEQDAVLEDGKKAAAGAEQGAGILNLTYRQGTDLPTLHYGFPDSHYICFPYETRRTGIYASGTVRSPMDSVAAKSDGLGAAMKAIQAIENVRKGTAVHPRSGDTTYPDFFMQRCTQCKRCTEECPFGTLDEDNKGTPLLNPNRCRRCGICMGACPERIISFKNYSVQIISSVIKSIEMPGSEEEKYRILAFLCENDAYPSLDLAAQKRVLFNPNIRVIPVRCLGSVSTSWINDAMSAGFDGVLLIGCKHGDDYQCHFIRGSELANIRMENVQEKLKQLVLEPERVEIHEMAIDEYDKLPSIFNTFAETIKGIGANPYKDM